MLYTEQLIIKISVKKSESPRKNQSPFFLSGETTIVQSKCFVLITTFFFGGRDI